VIRFISTTEGDTLTLSAKVNVEEARIGDSAGSSSGVTEADVDASNVASTVGIALYGNDGNNHLTGNGAANRIQGGDGDDVIDGGQGDDDLAGEAGDDVIDGGPGDDVLTGGAGDDVIDGGPGDDVLTGGADSDTFVVAGNDTIQDFEVVEPFGGFLDFEGITTDGWPTALAGYKGLTWSAVSAVDPVFAGYYDYWYDWMRTALTSPTCVAFSSGGGFSSPNSVADFDFVSGNFASFPYGGGYVNLYAYDDENLVGGVTLEMFGFVKAEVNFLEGVATGVYSDDFWGTFSSVDRVEFRHNYGPLAMG